MEITFRKDDNNSYLLLLHDEIVEMETYQVRMVLANSIKGLLRCSTKFIDENIYFEYEITGMQNLEEFTAKRKIEGVELQGYLVNIVDLYDRLQEFLLNSSCISLHPQDIYVDLETKLISIIFHPNLKKTAQLELRDLLEYLLPKIDHRDQMAVKLGYEVYRMLLKDEFQLEHIKAVVKGSIHTTLMEGVKEPELYARGADCFCIENSIENEPVIQRDESVIQREEGKILRGTYRKGICLRARVLIISTLLILFWVLYLFIMNQYISITIQGVVTVIGVIIGGIWCMEGNEISKYTGDEVQVVKQIDDDSEISCIKVQEKERYVGLLKTDETQLLYESTMVLSEPKVKVERLVAQGEGIDDILIDREVLIVGKLQHCVDVILQYPTVSRIHAKILKQEGQIYIMDLNSKNGTYINELIIPQNERRRITIGDKIIFGDVCFNLVL